MALLPGLGAQALMAVGHNTGQVHHCLSTAFSLSFHCLSTAFPLPFHCPSTVFPLPFHCLSTAFPPPCTAFFMGLQAADQSGFLYAYSEDFGASWTAPAPLPGNEPESRHGMSRTVSACPAQI